jgi:NADP-dependent 3-hydroxy acid dehydrogenase YdfG
MHLLIVGAGPGISGATARRLGGENYSIGLVARREEALAAHGAELREEGIRTEWATAQSGDPASLAAAIGQLVEALGPVDVLLYNVSVGRQAAVPDLAPEDLLADVAAGAVGLQTAVRAVLPGMRERGSGTVLATGSGTADRPIASLATLGVQKAALRALVQVQAAGLADLGVHVATVTIRGLVGEDKSIHPDRVADLYAELIAETAGPRENWRTVVDLSA